MSSIIPISEIFLFLDFTLLTLTLTLNPGLTLISFPTTGPDVLGKLT